MSSGLYCLSVGSRLATTIASTTANRPPPRLTGYQLASLLGMRRRQQQAKMHQPHCPFSAVLPRRESNGAVREEGGKAKDTSSKDQRREQSNVTGNKEQLERPCHREGIDRTAADPAQCQDGRFPRGKLLTTPTRLLKLILPLPMRAELPEKKKNKKMKEDKAANEELEPLALLVHPQQPLSHIERLLQAELPPLRDDKGLEKVPAISFHAEDAAHGDDRLQASGNSRGKGSQNGDGNGNVASYSGLGHLGPRRQDTRWVRWSSSTEVGDFIRDAARGREFAIEIEGYGLSSDNANVNIGEVRVAVPSFGDRTHYMHQRLRTMSSRIDAMSKLKNECDEAAHRGAHRLAQGGFAGLVGWWAVVYYASFHTEVGWDMVEPVTYLAGLTTIMGGYLWFLYISRDLSYRAALNVTVSRRQHALYKERGFDLQRWEQAVQEANALRREIHMVADEYDVEWDETKDLGGEGVKELLDKEEDEETNKQGSKSRNDQRQKETEREQHQNQKSKKDE